MFTTDYDDILAHEAVLEASYVKHEMLREEWLDMSHPANGFQQ